MFSKSLQKKKLLVARDYKTQKEELMPFTRSMLPRKEEYSMEEEADESVSGDEEVELEVEMETE